MAADDDDDRNDENFDERYFGCDSPELRAFSDVGPDIDTGETYCSPEEARQHYYRWEQKKLDDERRRGERRRKEDEGRRR